MVVDTGLFPVSPVLVPAAADRAELTIEGGAPQQLALERDVVVRVWVDADSVLAAARNHAVPSRIRTVPPAVRYQVLSE